MKMVYEDFKINPEPYVSSVLFYFFNEEYGLPVSLFNQKLFKSYQEKNYTIDIHQENTIYRAIMDDDKKTLIMFTQRDDFDKDIKLYSDLYPNDGYSLLEICCYHRSVNCFKYLITEYGSKITPKCLQLSFLSGNPDILNECLKNQNPDQACMTNAIVAQNIDFVQFLVNEYGLEIKLWDCALFGNIQAFLVYLDTTKDINNCFINSPLFVMPSLVEYFISLGVDVNIKDDKGTTALYNSAMISNKHIAEILISHGADINALDSDENTVLHVAAWRNSVEIAAVSYTHLTLPTTERV